jgi:hypothetical protein
MLLGRGCGVSSRGCASWGSKMLGRGGECWQRPSLYAQRHCAAYDYELMSVQLTWGLCAVSLA